MQEKTWIAYAIHRGESPCGCARTTYSHVYDESGNHYKQFVDKSKAISAAIAKKAETGADDWNVV